MDLFAKWEIETYLISFQLNGGEFTDTFNETAYIDSNTYLIGKNTNQIQEILLYYNVNSASYHLISFDYMGYSVEFIPVKDGFTFMGWYEDEYFEEEQSYSFGGGEVGNKMFFAKWQENPSPYHEFIPSGGSINRLDLDEFDPVTIIDKFVITDDLNQEILYIYESYITNKHGGIHTYVIINTTGVITKLDFFDIRQTINIDVTKANFYLYMGVSL